MAAKPGLELTATEVATRVEVNSDGNKVPATLVLELREDRDHDVVVYDQKQIEG